MSYQEAFASSLAAAGIAVDAAAVPEQEAVSADLDALQGWLNALDQDTRSAIDLVYGENPIKAGLADPGVGIVSSSLGPVLAAFDATPATLSVSAMLDTLRQAADAAAAAA